MSYRENRGTKLYVGNLSSLTTRGDLEYEFEYYGRLINVWVAKNPPGFAYIDFEDGRDADDAIRGLDGKEIHGRRIRVERSRTMPRGGGRGGRDDGRFGSGSRRPFHPTDRCYNCGESGHYAYDCELYTRRKRLLKKNHQPEKSALHENSMIQDLIAWQEAQTFKTESDHSRRLFAESWFIDKESHIFDRNDSVTFPSTFKKSRRSPSRSRSRSPRRRRRYTRSYSRSRSRTPRRSRSRSRSRRSYSRSRSRSASKDRRRSKSYDKSPKKERRRSKSYDKSPKKDRRRSRSYDKSPKKDRRRSRSSDKSPKKDRRDDDRNGERSASRSRSRSHSR